MKFKIPEPLQPLVPTAAMDRFLHHSNLYRFITYNGRKVGASIPNVILSSPDIKLCALFGAAAIGLSSAYVPEHIIDAVTYSSAALIATPLLGTILEGIVTMPRFRMFFDRRYSGHESARHWGNPYVIDKTPDGVNDRVTPQDDANVLAYRHRRMFRVMMIVTGGFVAIAALKAYKSGYDPKALFGAPFVGGITVRFMSSAERFERLRDGKYKLVKLPIQPATGRNPAP